MKTAISIPDAIFEKADACARRLGMSRSELYAKAVAGFIEEHGRDGVTALLDRVYSNEPSKLDVGLAALQFASIDPVSGSTRRATRKKGRGSVSTK